jgi:hypothetical protein
MRKMTVRFSSRPQTLAISTRSMLSVRGVTSPPWGGLAMNRSVESKPCQSGLAKMNPAGGLSIIIRWAEKGNVSGVRYRAGRRRPGR